MRIQQKKITTRGIKFFIKDGKKEIGHAYLYILKNDLHKEPFGFLEDVLVDENHRGQGLGTNLVQTIIKAAQKHGCYKLICTSRHSRSTVHALYERLGFKNHGLEFRMDFFVK
ncbi:MAG: GNAT family N-acetyltransferase [Patescibacteria group bacterium]